MVLTREHIAPSAESARSTGASPSRCYVSIVVPTYNEVENIPKLSREIYKALGPNGAYPTDYELLVIDDNSPDGTAQVAEGLPADHNVRVFCRVGARGLASAVICGFGKARGEVIGVMDADLQHPPELLPDLLHPLERSGVHLAIASRYIKGGSVIGWPAKRRFASKTATLLARTMFGTVRPIRDPMSGFFVMRREVIEGVALNPIGYKILLEILVKGKWLKAREVPYTFALREAGESKLSMRQQWDYLWHLAKLSVGKK